MCWDLENKMIQQTGEEAAFFWLQTRGQPGQLCSGQLKAPDRSKDSASLMTRQWWDGWESHPHKIWEGLLMYKYSPVRTVSAPHHTPKPPLYTPFILSNLFHNMKRLCHPELDNLEKIILWHFPIYHTQNQRWVSRNLNLENVCNFC